MQPLGKFKRLQTLQWEEEDLRNLDRRDRNDLEHLSDKITVDPNGNT